MDSAFRFSVDANGVGRLVFDLPNEKVNTFSLPVIEQLEKIIDEAAQNKAIKILAISSAKEGIFIAGADLHSFERMASDQAHVNSMIDTGHRVFDKIANLPYPTVALINGACLGGGMELALACTYRVVSDHPKATLGLPEVSLGIIPGWGGTQRLPRLIGLVDALPLILGGKPVKAFKAWKMKMADAIFAAEFFDAKGDEFLKYCLTPEGKNKIAARRRQHGLRFQLLENNPIGRKFLFRKAKSDILSKTRGHYPAPLVALDLIAATCRLPLQKGLSKEKEAFKNNVATAFSNAKNLIQLFFTQEMLKKDPGVTVEVKPLKVSSVGVIGAGTMGSGIAWLFCQRDIFVRLKDVSWKAIGNGIGAVYSIYAKMLKDKRIKPSEVSLKFHRLSGTIDYSGFKNVDLVVEAAAENLELKHQILRELEGTVRKDTIIGTNTSSLTLADMGSVMKYPERLIGMHFFNPANRMPLVEIVISYKTSPQVIATTVDLCRKLGKTPIVVHDCPGFLVNRIFIAGANEIMRMYEEGVSHKALESMMLDFGMPMSPFALADEVGNDVGNKVSHVFQDAYGSRMAVPKIVTAMYENGLFGKKCGKGFYIYSGKKIKFNPEVEHLRKGLGITPKQVSDRDMSDRVFLLMINEASRCLQEKVITNPAYLDMALIMGIGFPPFRGGLLRYADSLGIDYIVNQLKSFQSQYGDRFTPSEALLDMQKDKKSFFNP